MATPLATIWKVAAIGFVIGSCLFGQATAEDKSPVRVKGSNVWAYSVEGWVKRFVSKNPAAIVVVSGGGTASGMQALCQREAEIAMASHFLDQEQKTAAADRGIDLQEKLVSWDAIAFFVNRDNPVSELTFEQARSIFMGQVTRWKGVGGADAPVELYIDEDPKSETSMLVQKLVLAFGTFASNANLKRYPKFIFQAVSGNKNGVGCAPLRRAVEFQSAFPVKLLAMSRTSSDPAILPSKETIANRTYPVILPLFFYWDGKSASKRVIDFVSFCEEEGRPR